MTTSSTKIISKILLYVVIIGGAFLMLIPFAWMVATSFKAPSEVSSWPPVWTTKNAASSFTFKTQIKQKSASSSVDLSTLSLSEFRNFAALMEESASFDTLTINLDDDPVRRGEIEIQLLEADGSPADYSTEVDRQTFESLVERYHALATNFPDSLSSSLKNLPADDVGRFLDGFFNVAVYGDNGFVRRVVLVTSLKTEYSKAIERLVQSVETSMKELPIDNDESKLIKTKIREEAARLFENPVAGLKRSIENLESYRTGNTGVTDLTELEKVVEDLREGVDIIRSVASEVVTLSKEISSGDSRVSVSVRQLERSLEAVPSGLIQWMDLLDLYSDLRVLYNESQNESLSCASIVGEIRSDSEVHSLLSDFVNQWDIDEQIRNHLLTKVNPSNVRNAVSILLNYLDSNFKESLSEHFSDVQTPLEAVNDAMNFLRTSLLVASDTVLDEKVNSAMDEETSYSSLTRLIEEVASAAGQTIGVGGVVATLDRQASISGDEPFAELIRRRWKETDLIGTFSRIHSDIFSELDLSSKPDEVERVYYRGIISPSGAKSFDIKLKEIPAVWLKDDISAGKANFTLGETLRNFFQNYISAWNAAPFGRYYFNTVFVAIVTTFVEIIFAAMAAFAFAKMEFFGKNLLFTLFLATMMVPGEVLLVPNYITLTALGWIDSYYALIVPWVVSVFAIFLLRQHFMTIPNELYDAAMIDGLSKWRFLWTILVPLSKPAVITGALLKFVGSWNSFLWVLIVTKSPEIRTLPVGLQNFSSATGSDYHLLMAAATFSIIPVVILFLITQKYFIAGIARSGLK
ncbi:MAG: ABC transporter permease subunit [Kosmotogaceae bacterium]|nr:ABC transporter permease subunit [Kosmotogaceae bacterium]